MNWQLDTGHAYIGFTGRHMMVATVRGEFERFGGTVVFDEHDLTRSTVDIQIEAASVNSRNLQRDDHFRSADFFDVEHFPSITFKSKEVILTDANHGILKYFIQHLTDQEISTLTQMFGRVVEAAHKSPASPSPEPFSNPS